MGCCPEVPEPDWAKARVPRPKVVDYLLSTTHADGMSKAFFFLRMGYVASRWRQFAEALRRHAANHGVTRVMEDEFGYRYVVEGTLVGPNGRAEHIRAVWFMHRGGRAASLATAYPSRLAGRKESHHDR